MSVEIPPGYEPTETEEYMSDQQLAWFRQRLLDWQKELLEDSDHTIEALRDEDWKEPDPNDRATHEEEASLELRTRDRERKLLRKIEEAIWRIDEGDYGYCEETGDPIGVARLKVRPIATLTVQAQERREEAQQRSQAL